VIFEIENARVWRGDILALKDFSLTLRHGESVAILGPNHTGCINGKNGFIAFDYKRSLQYPGRRLPWATAATTTVLPRMK
jgi:ABC-type taurine transport system ATPase subunit